MRLKLPNLRKTAIAIALAGFTLIPVATHALDEWGPQNRPPFTWANPATYVTFNSITDNPVAGDERRFYTANQVGVDTHSHNLAVSDGEEVTLRTYFHNNAAADLNLVAHNTRVKMTVPSGEATDQTSVSYISADNANPVSVWDSLHLTSDKAFSLEYEAGSAKLFNNVFTAGTSISDSIVTDAGAPVGYDKVDGNVPGCSEFSGWVTIRVKVHMKETPPPTPAYTCDLLDISSSDDRTVKVTALNTTATNGAVFKNAVVDWGDNSTPLTDSNVVGKSHQYSKDGTYTITATAHFTVNGEDKSATSAACAKQVTFKSNQPPHVTPPPNTPSTPSTPTSPSSPATPTALVNTGAGSIAGLFAASSIIGTLAYRYMLSRRLSRD